MSSQTTPQERAKWTRRSTVYAAMFVYELVLTALAVPSGQELAFVAVVFGAAVFPLAVQKHLPRDSAYTRMTPKNKVVDMLSTAGTVATLVAVLHLHFVIAALTIAPVIVMLVLHRKRKW